jgi:hypothetical protein
MSDLPRYTDDLEAFPGGPQPGRPAPGGRKRALVVALSVVGALVAGGVVVAAGLTLVQGLNPVGNEWICSDGEAPAGPSGRYNNCYVLGSTLPPGVEWDPFGNRPMPYNCDKAGGMQIERTVTRRGVSDTEQDCVREGTELPGRWHPVSGD